MAYLGAFKASGTMFAYIASANTRRCSTQVMLVKCMVRVISATINTDLSQPYPIHRTVFRPRP